MTEVVLFHHVQGLTDGLRASADELRAGGHTVHAPDLFDGEGVPWTRGTLARGGGFGLLRATGSPPAEAIQIETALRAPATTP